MSIEYSVEVCRELEKSFREAQLFRPMRIGRYDQGAQLVYDVWPVDSAGGTDTTRLTLDIERFVGGGFAGQVYKVRVKSIECPGVDGIEAGGVYAMKILLPPSRFSTWFRNLLYGIGFQGPFQLQCNPAAARNGALWQKFIRRAAKIRFGDQRVVNDVHATFVDSGLGSLGELSDWIDGRTWRLEVDDRMDLLNRWRRGKPVDTAYQGSPEYRAKKRFMAEFTAMLHEIGAAEFARQYEWSTCKSQPNCLKRSDTDDEPSEGLVAVDFRAGLALLPFLPMSPGDIGLILKGAVRGSLVQFDRGDIPKLEKFVAAHGRQFDDMREMLRELKETERVYRDSTPDITHNHVRLLYSGKLWSTMLSSALTGWRVRNCIDDSAEKRLRASRLWTLALALVGLVPFVGRVLMRLWGRGDWRRHYRKIFTSWFYLRRAMRGLAAEKAIQWHRAQRLTSRHALCVGRSFLLCALHLPLSILPAGLHKFLTNWQYAKERLDHILLRPVRLYFNSALRGQWLRDMVQEGRDKHIISHDDAGVILGRIAEPFIQKYLKSLAVHVCTLPVTQVVSVSLALVYWFTHPDLPRAQVFATAAGIIVAFQVVPISPGSLVRGLYVLYLVVRERNFKDYNIAVFLGFFKYVGYLAFPIQMTYRYPTLARFMAAHWATEAVHVVPVFGESGALLEHGVFCLFYNWPLTIRRRMRRRAELRSSQPHRCWHVGLYALGAACVFGAVDYGFYSSRGALPGLRDIAWLVVLLPLVSGSLVTLGCGGAALQRRIVSSATCGIVLGGLSTALSVIAAEGTLGPHDITVACVWRMFLFGIFAVIGAVLTELYLPDPDLKRALQTPAGGDK